MSKITNQMVSAFNEMMQDQESIVRIYKSEGNDYAYEIKPMKDRFIKDDSLVYPTQEYYDMLETYFKSYDIEPTYNNTGTTFWSR